MPRFETLRQAVGENMTVRVLTLDYDLLDRLGDNEADVVIYHDRTANAPADGVTLFRETVMPVCAPGFTETHAQVLAGPVAGWGSLPFLRFSRPSQTRVSRDDWFEATEFSLSAPRYTDFEDLAFLFEAALAGRGVALGWRHYVERHVDVGTLVPVADPVEFDRGCFARLTERGRQRPEARTCLDALDALAGFEPATFRF